jgi:hypothetical protein
VGQTSRALIFNRAVPLPEDWKFPSHVDKFTELGGTPTPNWSRVDRGLRTIFGLFPGASVIRARRR